MIVLKIVGIFFASLYGIYLLIGAIFILREFLLLIGSLLWAPLWSSKKVDEEHDFSIAPLLEQIKEIPILVRDLFRWTIIWIILPFEVGYALFKKEEAESKPGE